MMLRLRCICPKPDIFAVVDISAASTFAYPMLGTRTLKTIAIFQLEFRLRDPSFHFTSAFPFMIYQTRLERVLEHLSYIIAKIDL